MPTTALARLAMGFHRTSVKTVSGLGLLDRHGTTVPRAFIGLHGTANVIPMWVPHHGKALTWIFMAPTAMVTPGNAMENVPHENE